jgi:hypothetical protein
MTDDDRLQPPNAADGQVSYTGPADVPAPTVPVDDTAEKPHRSRARTAVISALVGLILVFGGLYLVAGFGPRLYDAAANAWVASTSNIALATIGAVCLFVAVLLNGWSPWSTAIPGVLLTGVGVWSVISAAGAAWVVSLVGGAVGSSELILPGVHIMVLIIGLLLLAASIAVTIARSAGRSRGRI